MCTGLIYANAVDELREIFLALREELRWLARRRRAQAASNELALRGTSKRLTAAAIGSQAVAEKSNKELRTEGSPI